MSQKYEFIEHPADIAVKAYGSSRQEVFINSALGMMEFLFGKEILTQKPEKEEKIRIKSPDIDSLLIDWLSELLYLTNTNYRAYTNFTFEEFSGNKLLATAGSIKAQALDDIKAVTRHNLKIEEVEGRWEATVTYDI